MVKRTPCPESSESAFAIAKVAGTSTQASAHFARCLLASKPLRRLAYRVKGQRARRTRAPALRYEGVVAGTQASAHFAVTDPLPR